MRARQVTIVTLAGLVSLGGTGCVSLKRTPGARFFVLRSLAQPESTAAAAASTERFVAVLPVRIPGALDRPQLVTWTGPNEVRFDEFLRWAEPLDAGATRTLAEDLALLLPQQRVLPAPWPASAAPRCRVATELRVFGVQPDGQARLEASVALLAPREERVLLRRSFAASRAVSSGRSRSAGPVAAVEAMSELLNGLAKEIASAIQSLPQGAP